MNFSINIGSWNSIFIVPSDVVDTHIKMAGALQLKVLLWLLRHAGKNFTEEDIAKSLNAQAVDVRDAAQYWIEIGILFDQEKISSVSEKKKQNSAQIPLSEEFEISSLEKEKYKTDRTTQEIKKKNRRIPKPDGLFIAQRINNSTEIASLMHEAQEILGGPVSPGLSSVLLYMHDDYGMPIDVLTMLLQYVKSIGKCNTIYIEAVAKDWVKKEIFTHAQVEEHLKYLDERAKAWTIIEQTLLLNHRSPSAKEEEYSNRWIREWKFSKEMIREAYERCVNAIGKMELKYINKILERWNKNQIKTLESAKNEQTDKKDIQQDYSRKTTYDIEEYERMTIDIPKLYKES